MDEWHWFVLDVNPEPWAIGDLAVGRRNGKVYPYVGRNNQLHFYKEAIKEELGSDPGVWIDGSVELKFFFWRRRDQYATTQARTHRKHEADLTNLQKATEDALQGVLFKNDKDVVKCTSRVVEQGPDAQPAVVVGIRKAVDEILDMPGEVYRLVEELRTTDDNSWG